MNTLHIVLAWMTPVALIILGVGIGQLLYRVVLVKAADAFRRRNWFVQTSLVEALRRVILLWCIVSGVYAALLIVPTPQNLLIAAQKVLTAVVLISATLTVGRLAADLVDSYGYRLSSVLGSKSTTRTMSLLSTSAQLVVWLTGALIVLDSLGIAITPLLTALGVGGLAVALALQAVLSNIFSGLELIASRYVRPGDYIRLDTGSEGLVVDINWRNTTIRDATNTLIIVPNDKLASAVIWNYHLPEKDVFTLAIDVQVTRASNLESIENVAVDVARDVVRDVTSVDSAPEPFVRFTSITPDQVNVTTFVQAGSYMDGSRIRHEFIKRLHSRLAHDEQRPSNGMA